MPSLTAKILAPCCALLAAACERAPAELVLSGPTMGTTYTVRVVAPPVSVDSTRLRATVDDVLAQIDQSMSGYRSESEVARFNASASTDWYDVSADLAAVAKAALDVSEASAGAFDITVAPLVAGTASVRGKYIRTDVPRPGVLMIFTWPPDCLTNP